MKASIVVPAFNEERLLGRTLQSLQAVQPVFANAGWEAETIVCDNNSTDRTSEIAEAAGAKVVFEPYNQIARARNRGAEAASGDWLIFVDADSQPSAQLFAQVLEQIASGRCLAGGVTVKLDAESLLPGLAIRLWNCISRSFKLLAGGFIFCETAAFREAGGFNLEFFAGEELDLSNRLKVLARKRGKSLVILHQYPMMTSARKFHLYSMRETLWLLARTVLSFGRTCKNRDACDHWYDGRR
jgi:glycosyltransferase involved in cell wall biosynthesis